MNYNAIESAANRLHASAVTHSTKVIDGERYTLDFVQGGYVVTDSTGQYVVKFNTRKITQAKNWLIDYCS